MTCRLVAAKPFSESILEYCEFENISLDVNININKVDT